ncbi:MAG: nucleoid-associated protein [Bacillota bacterium]|nr:nucleoid-associated protein [Bacillota bacterium]
MDAEINVRKTVLHILDNNINVPVLSSGELEMDGETCDFVEKMICRVLNDNNLKNARFAEENNDVFAILKAISRDGANFLESSLQLADILFGIMVKHVDIPPADLVCCLFDFEGSSWFGFLKLNYKVGYTHFVMQDEGTNINTIIKQRTLLPSEGQKIEEACFINLGDLNIRLVEKEYEINGEKEFYLSKVFMHCATDLSNNEKLKIIDKAAKKISKKYFDEDFDKTALLKKVTAESLEETKAIKVDSIADRVFDKNIEIRNEYISEIQKSGLSENEVAIPEALAEKKFRTHRIKTDTGIEINFPLSCYNDSDKIEFLNNPDGTVSIVIKNVAKITSR